MAQRRMFSLQIVDTDAFLDMPQSAQLLYFHLSMRADDDGFISNPKKISKITGSNDDDLKVLLSKRFIISFESGVVVIKHWKIHNYIQKDRYNETKYIEEKKRLITKDNGSYTECIQDVSSMETQVRLGKVRLGKSKVRVISDDKSSREVLSTKSKEIIQVIDVFSAVNPNSTRWYGNTTQRASIARMLDTHGLDIILKVIALLPKTNTMEYMPSITTPVQLEDKWASLSYALQKKKAETLTKNTIAEIS